MTQATFVNEMTLVMNWELRLYRLYDFIEHILVCHRTRTVYASGDFLDSIVFIVEE